MRFKILKQGGYGTVGISPAGGNMSGPVVLTSAPTEPLQAATKGYVDASLGNLNGVSLVTGLVPVERLPVFTGDLINVAGSNSFSLSTTGVTPSTYPKVTVTAKGRITNGYLLAESDLPGIDWSKIASGKPTTMSGYGITDAVAPTGGVLTGPLVVNNEPTAPLHIATKAYVDSLNAGSENSTLKVGDMVRKVTTVTPPGFLRCNGGEVSATTYSALFEILKVTYVAKVTLDYSSQVAIGAGRPWDQQYDFKTASETNLTWTAGTKLPVATSTHQCIVTRNRAYLIGGLHGAAIYSAPIGDDGTLGAWATNTSLPAMITRFAIFMTKNRVYIAGGYEAGNNSTKLYSADINADGTLGTWTLAGNLPAAVVDCQAMLTKNRVYIFNSIGTHYTAPINADGTVGAWVAYTDANFAPDSTMIHGVFATRNRFYHAGRSVLKTAVVNTDGTLGAWTTVANGFPFAYYSCHAVVTKTRVWLIAGYAQAGGSSNLVFTAPVNADGTIGAFVQSANNYGATLSRSAAIVTKNRVYLLGGTNGVNLDLVYTAPLTGDHAINDYSAFYNGSINKFDGNAVTGEIAVQNSYGEANNMPGSGKPWSQQYLINKVQSGSLTNWVADGSLYESMSASQAVVTKNRVYLLGGFLPTGTSSSYMYYADINADGSLSTWTRGNSFTKVTQAQVVVIKNRAYVFGGNNDTSTLDSVRSADIREDGTISSWTIVGNLPLPRAMSQAFVTTNRVYVVGGFGTTTGGTSVCFSAPINADGTLGAWITETEKLASPASKAQVVVTNNRVYLLGGAGSDNNATANVQTAPINADGTVGKWTITTSLPAVSAYGQVVVTQNKVYLFQGSAIYSAPINTDGTLGVWSSDGTLPVALTSSQAVVVKNKIYLLGGNAPGGNGTTATIYSTSFAGGLNDYSPYYDGTITPTAAGNFRLPDYSSKELPGSYTYIKV